MSFLSSAKDHYSSLIDATQSIEIPEWKDGQGNPLRIYYKPMTVADRIRIRKHAKNDAELTIEVIIAKAIDAEGNPIFTREHKMELLRNVSASVLDRIALEINGDPEVLDVEEQEKN
jgi:uncharacterized cupredoxin-like copper-binding protein